MNRLDRFRDFLFEETREGPSAFRTRAKNWLSLFYHVGRKSWEDQFAQRAAALSFFTLLNLFPFIGILLFILSHSHIFHANVANIEDALIQQMVTPAARQLVVDIFSGLSQNLYVLGTGLSGLIALLVLLFLGTSLILMVERSLNEVFRCSELKSRFLSRSAYLWAAMTLLPIIMGLSFALTSHLKKEYVGFAFILHYFLPYLFTLAGFMILYRVIPRVRIKFRVVLLVSVISGLFWELAKVGLSHYVDMIFARSAVGKLYGSMALVPIGMVWIYYSWIIVLLGAELAYVLQNIKEVRVESRRQWLIGKGYVPLSRRVAISMVLNVFKKYSAGEGPSRLDELISRYQLHPDQAGRWFEALATAKVFVPADENALLPTRPADSVGVEEISKLYDETFHRLLAADDSIPSEWARAAQEGFEHSWRNISFDDLLKERNAEPKPDVVQG